MSIVAKVRAKCATIAEKVKGLTAKVYAKSLAFVKSLLFVQLFTASMAFPGLLYLLDAYDVLPALAAPIWKEMGVKKKFAAIGLKYPSPEVKAIMAAIGASKISILINHFVWKGLFDKEYFIVSIPGFLLVIYAHRMCVPAEPLVMDVSVLLIIAAFYRIYALGKAKAD
jgi:hypothetical protein